MATNNDAEYEVLIADLKLNHKIKDEKLNVFSDSMLIVWRIRRSFQVKGTPKELYMRHAQNLVSEYITNFLNK